MTPDTRAPYTKRSFTMMCPLLIIRSHVMRRPLKMPTQMRRNFDPLTRRRGSFPRDLITTVILYNDYINVMLSDLDVSFIGHFYIYCASNINYYL